MRGIKKIYIGKKEKIDGIDTDSFEILDINYSRDRNNVYGFKGIKIEGADPESFKVLNDAYAKDKTSVYWDGKKLERADPATI